MEGRKGGEGGEAYGTFASSSKGEVSWELATLCAYIFTFYT